MAIDTSGSMQNRWTSAEAAPIFSKGLNKGDKAFLLAFARIRDFQTWSAKLADMHDVLAKLRGRKRRRCNDAVPAPTLQACAGKCAVLICTSITRRQISFASARVRAPRRGAVYRSARHQEHDIDGARPAETRAETGGRLSHRPAGGPHRSTRHPGRLRSQYFLVSIRADIKPSAMGASGSEDAEGKVITGCVYP